MAMSHRNPQQLDNIVMEINMVAAQAKKAVAYESFIREIAEETGLDFPADQEFTPEQLEQLKTHVKSLMEGKETDQARKAVTYERFILEVLEEILLILSLDENLTLEKLNTMRNCIRYISKDHEKILGNKTVAETLEEKEKLRLQNEKLTKWILDDIAKKTEFMKTVEIPTFRGALPAPNEGSAPAEKSPGGVTQAKDSSDESNGNKKRQRTTSKASNSRSHNTVSFALPGPNEGGARSEKSPGHATQADDAGEEGNSDKKRRRVSSMKLHSSAIVNSRSIALVAPIADGAIAEKASGGVTQAIVATDEENGNKKTRRFPLTFMVPSPTEGYAGGSSAGSTPTSITQEEGVRSETIGNKRRSSTRAIKPTEKYRSFLFDIKHE